VILMDVQMPEMDGYETAKFIRMRRESEKTPIIFITAHGREAEQIPIAYASGAVDFILGPIIPDTLRAKVAIFVDLFLKSVKLEQSLSDVTKISDQFRDSEARIRAVLDNVADGIITVDDDGGIESFNRAAIDLFGYSEEEAVGQRFSSLIESKFPSDFPAGERSQQHFLAEHRQRGRATASVGRRKDGSTFQVELDLSDVELGSRTVHIGCLRDVSERQTYTDALQYQALHDDLTDLPNRALFEDRVGHALSASVRTGRTLALLVMDLDGFKGVNDMHGHQQGDLLLKLVANRILGCTRTEDTVARLGGDEFGILLADTDLGGAASVAWKIQQAFEPGFVIEGVEIGMRASIGITFAPEHGNNIDDLLRRADLAMYGAKRSGQGYAVFTLEQEETPARRLALLSDLRSCIQNDELTLHYQPKIDLATNETIGVEALIRWNHPSGELLMPGDFIPEVERNELIIPITEWVINEALKELRGWRDRGYDLNMAINLSARCLGEGAEMFETVDELMARWEIPATDVTLELTESDLIDTTVPGLLERLQNINERLSIDDFGTGYSSLIYLQKLPIVEIKADRSFVSTLATVKDDAVIVRSIIDLAHNLSLKVVAEGVEDEETMEMLIGYGCDEAQGYFFSRPIPSEQLIDWLESSPYGLKRRVSV